MCTRRLAVVFFTCILLTPDAQGLHTNERGERRLTVLRQVSEWLIGLRTRNYSPATITNYGQHLRSFSRFAGDPLVETIETATIDSWLTYLAERGNGPRTLLCKLRSVRSFCAWLLDTERIDKNPALRVKPPRPPTKLPEYLNKVEARALLSQPDRNNGFAGRRDGAILELLYLGLRRGEVLKLDVLDVDLEDETLRINGKGSRQRILPLGRAACSTLKQYLRVRSWKARPDETALFVSPRGKRMSPCGLWRLVKRYGRKAGIKKGIHPHMLRHSFGTHMIDGGCDLRTLQELMGHASIKTTQIYTHISDERQRQMLRKCHPRG